MAADKGAFLLTGSLLPSPTYPHISTTPDIPAMPVKASQNQAEKTISDDSPIHYQNFKLFINT